MVLDKRRGLGCLDENLLRDLLTVKTSSVIIYLSTHGQTSKFAVRKSAVYVTMLTFFSPM